MKAWLAAGALVLALAPSLALAEEAVNTTAGTLREANDAKEMPDDPAASFSSHGSVVKMEGGSFLSANAIHQRDNKLTVISNLRYHGITAFGAEGVQMIADAKWLRFTGFKASGFLDYELNSRWKGSFSLGAGSLELDHFENVRYEKRALIPLWRAKAIFIVAPGTELRFGGNNDFAFTGWCNRSGGGEVLSVDNIFAEAESSGLPAWQLKSSARYSILSDNNRQFAFDHGAMREIITMPFTMLLGVGGGWMGYREQTIYWSPDRFSEISARAVFKKAFSRRFYSELKLRAGYHRTRAKMRETDLAAEALLRYAPNSKWRLELAGNFFDANGGAWWRRDIALRLEMRL
ncbi:MAG: hypothetical protein EOP11_10940 [Proteobacteria bacterium]|nr:MAG: hypothetical protein EOP11_10940 [Pseudomonadota bacterium]